MSGIAQPTYALEASLKRGTEGSRDLPVPALRADHYRPFGTSAALRCMIASAGAGRTRTASRSSGVVTTAPLRSMIASVRREALDDIQIRNGARLLPRDGTIWYSLVKNIMPCKNVRHIFDYVQLRLFLEHCGKERKVFGVFR